MIELGPEIGAPWTTVWVTVAAAVWNEHNLATAPADCEWVLVGVSVEASGRELARMGFALTPDVVERYDMDGFIDEVAFPELLSEVEKVRPLGDVVVNRPGSVPIASPFRGPWDGGDAR